MSLFSREMLLVTNGSEKAELAARVAAELAKTLVVRAPNSTADRAQSLGALLARYGPQEGEQQTLRHKEEHS